MRNLVKSIGITIVIMTLLLIIVPAQAQLISCTGSLGDCILQNTTQAGGFFGDPNVNLPVFIGNIIKFLLTLIGIVFLVLIIYGGFLWMTAGGNEQRIQKAGATLRNSAIGLAIIVVSYAITITVFDIILKAAGTA